MDIKRIEEEGKLIVLLKGSLDTESAPVLEQNLSNLERVELLILDFQEVEYISSAGLRTLLTFQKVMSSKGKLELRNVTKPVKEVLDITGFSDIFTII